MVLTPCLLCGWIGKRSLFTLGPPGSAWPISCDCAVGCFPEAVLITCSDSPVTVETETPNRLFQCVSPFPGLACSCRSLLPTLLWVGSCNLSARSVGKVRNPRTHVFACVCERMEEEVCGEGLVVSRGGFTLKPGARGQRSFSAKVRGQGPFLFSGCD